MDVPVGFRRRRQSDFLRMLRQLGANPGAGPGRFDAEVLGICDIQHVFFHCRYDQWLQTFGEPEAVSPGFGGTADALIRTWQHQCVDGPVTCIGYLCAHPSGVRWVVVIRVCFSRRT